MSDCLSEKHILLGVTGSIAAYKGCLVLRQLQSLGARIRVMMTESARKFVGKWTFEALTQKEVITNLFPAQRFMSTEHIHIADWADAVLICPATANCIGKVASGIADDFLTTTVMASRAPVVFAPAMDSYMFENPVYRHNCDRLRELGYIIMDTESGHLASGFQGRGRLADPKDIVDCMRKVLSGSKTLEGKKVLVTAGPTREHLDAIRFISNPSSGKMGIAMAEEAFLRGGEVTLICGPTREPVMKGIARIDVESAKEMAESVLNRWDTQDALIMAAAVSDYTPKTVASGKIKKSETDIPLALKSTMDIAENAGQSKGDRLVVGFAMETDNALENASLKLKRKNLDLICLNVIDESNAAFGAENNILTLIDRNGNVESLPELSKKEASRRIWDAIQLLMGKNE